MKACCLGTGMAQLLIPTVAIHEQDLEPVPAHWELRTLPLPAIRARSYRLPAQPRSPAA